MRIRFATAAGLLLGVVIAVAATTWVQAAPPWPPRGEGEQPKPKTESVKTTGTIQGIRGDVMHVVNRQTAREACPSCTRAETGVRMTGLARAAASLRKSTLSQTMTRISL